jgi:hypothetical protein
MRKAAVQPNRRRRVAVRTKAAPVLGWNARDAIASMKELFAVILDNWWPNGATVDLRKGSSDYVTGFASAVETLATYRPKTGSQKLFAWAGTALYDASAIGAVGAAVVSGLTNARWQFTNFGNSAGHFLICLNGTDDMRLYDGATWKTINAGSTPSITNVLTANLIGVFVFKERPWYIQRDAMSLWYPAAGAITGALTEFPLQGVFKKGGYLMAGGSWSIDAGNGPDDYMVLISSEGEVVMYVGVDPASLSKVGNYQIGKPIGRRCIEQFGNDLAIITTDGLIPISRVPGNGDANKAIALTDNIQTAMAQAVSLYGTRFGWQTIFYAEASMLLLNVPVAAGSQQQFVMNSIGKAWARFLPKGTCPGWPANCFEVMNGELYFGGATMVRKAWTGTADAGFAIESDVLPAFNAFGFGDRELHFLQVKPIIAWDQNPTEIRIDINVNYTQTAPTSQITLPATTSGTWDSGTFDSAQWAGVVTANEGWYGVTGMGFNGALRMSAKSANAVIQLSAIVYAFEITN